MQLQLPQTVEAKGQRVLLTSQLAKAYGTERQIISNNYTRNKKRYVEGKHVIILEGKYLRDFKANHQIDDNLKFAKILYLWTEKGALLHAKSLNTDKAWEVYDYLVDFYFREKEDNKQQNALVPVDVKLEPLKDELPQEKECQDAIEIFKILLKAAEVRGLKVKTKPFQVYKSRLRENKIAVGNNLTLEEVNFEIAFELFHSVVNYDKGDMINSPLSKYYNAQAEKAAGLIISLLNEKNV